MMTQRTSMNPDRWQVVKDIFYEALDLEDGDRQRLLRELERETREEVEALLKSASEDGGLLDSPLDTDLLPSGVEKAGPALPAPSPVDRPAPLTGVTVGPYRVGERIGRGGMGDVYRARRVDGLFDREVAVKVVRDGADTQAVLDRFAAERRILGSLEHPGIARLISAGSEEEGPAAGRPWLALELVEGVPITDAAKRPRPRGPRPPDGRGCRGRPSRASSVGRPPRSQAVQRDGGRPRGRIASGQAARLRHRQAARSRVRLAPDVHPRAASDDAGVRGARASPRP